MIQDAKELTSILEVLGIEFREETRCILSRFYLYTELYTYLDNLLQSRLFLFLENELVNRTRRREGTK